jgi:hypothetical protein
MRFRCPGILNNFSTMLLGEVGYPRDYAGGAERPCAVLWRSSQSRFGVGLAEGGLGATFSFPFGICYCGGVAQGFGSGESTPFERKRLDYCEAQGISHLHTAHEVSLRTLTIPVCLPATVPLQMSGDVPERYRARSRCESSPGQQSGR